MPKRTPFPPEELPLHRTLTEVFERDIYLFSEIHALIDAGRLPVHFISRGPKQRPIAMLLRSELEQFWLSVDNEGRPHHTARSFHLLCGGPAPVQTEPLPHADHLLGRPAPARRGTDGRKQRRSTSRDRVQAVAREKYPPDGVPPEHDSNSQIVQAVGAALQDKGQEVPDRKTILRAVGRDLS
jgi:hypothetical protein